MNEFSLVSSWKSSVTDNTAIHTDTFVSPIKLDDQSRYSIALSSLETYYSFPNIIEGYNNVFQVTYNGVVSRAVLNTGSYKFDTLVKTIQSQLSDLAQYFSVFQIVPEMKCDIFFAVNCTVDFTAPHSMHNVLGYNPKVLEHGHNVSDNIISNQM